MLSTRKTLLHSSAADHRQNHWTTKEVIPPRIGNIRRPISESVLRCGQETAPVEEKIQSILSWMSSPAAQLTPVFVGEPSDRNPIDTLNFQAPLQLCGTATNAFENLAVSDEDSEPGDCC